MQIVKGFGKKSLKKLKKFFTRKLPLKSLKPLILLGENAFLPQKLRSLLFLHSLHTSPRSPPPRPARGVRGEFLRLKARPLKLSRRQIANAIIVSVASMFFYCAYGATTLNDVGAPLAKSIQVVATKWQ